MQKTLANSELAIMNLLWEKEPLTAREIRESLYPKSEKAQHGTVQRLLQRLVKKGFVTKDSDQFVHLFQPALSRQSYAGVQLESLAGKLTSGSFAPMITHLIEHSKITKDDLKRIKELLDNADTEGKP